MSSSSLVKVVAAFVTGILFALVGALAYVKISDRSPSEPVVKSAPPPDQVAAVPTPPQTAEPPAAAGEDTEVTPTEEKTPPREKLSSLSHKYTRHQTGLRVARLTRTEAKLPAHPGDSASTPDPQSTAASQPENNPPPPSPYSQNESNSNAASSSPTIGVQPEPVETLGPVQPAVPARQPQTVTLEQGTSVVIRLGEALSTEHNYTGDSFRGTLERPVIMNGFVIADKGSRVLGRIVNADKPGRVRGEGDLALALTEINTTDGQRVPVQTSSFDKKAKNNAGRDAARVGGGAALGAIIGAIAGGGKGAGIGAGIGGAAGAGDVLLTRRQPAAIPNETVLTFRLTTPVTITERIN